MCDRCLARNRAFRILWQQAHKSGRQDIIDTLKEAYAKAARQLNKERAAGKKHHEIDDPETLPQAEAVIQTLEELISKAEEAVAVVEVGPKSFPAAPQNPDGHKN